MILSFCLIWLLTQPQSLIIANHHNHNDDDQNGQRLSTIVSFNNDSLQKMVNMTTSSSNIIDTNQQHQQQQLIEQERILARERVKQNHLNFIREQLMQILLAGRTPPTPNNVTVSSLNVDANVVQIKKVVENGNPPIPSSSSSLLTPITSINPTNVRSSSSSLSEIYAQRLQSFYPTCNTNAGYSVNIDHQQQQRQMEMKLYFDLNIPKLPDKRTHITIMWAKLRLFMMKGPCYHLNDNNDESLSKCNEADNKIIISLYQLIPRPSSSLSSLKHNDNVRFIDRQTISGSYRGHIDFNVQNVINVDWQNQSSNYGFLIRMENGLNNQISPFRFIQQMNCSDNVSPIPNLAELYGKNIINLNQTFNNSLQLQQQDNHRFNYPTLDLMTMEMAKDEHNDDITQIMSPSMINVTNLLNNNNRMNE
uniref:Uncharacterized protein LOC113797052 n=1 Tax=Dermatophagoides pteronyssinus TaxID=6956 RepID=A0A6P6YCU7_DERPT|nr:uncharacterized protein LOC113797052 [Dermatophagoides pteronyssinus]